MIYVFLSRIFAVATYALFPPIFFGSWIDSANLFTFTMYGDHLQRLILETCDLWDIWSKWWGEMTWPTKKQWQWQIQRQRQWQIHLENNPRHLWPLRHLIRMIRGHELTNNNTVTKTIPQTCDIRDTNYNSDNWEPEFMTTFVAWQLRATLDSIRNSCDV